MHARDICAGSQNEEQNDRRKLLQRSVPQQVPTSHAHVSPQGYSADLSKAEVVGSRPCGVTLRAPPDAHTPRREPWSMPEHDAYRYTAAAQAPTTEHLYPQRNISPRQTFQENMRRILVPPRSDMSKIVPETSAPLVNFPLQTDESISKKLKMNSTPDPKYCDVPYLTNPLLKQQHASTVRNNDVYMGASVRGWSAPTAYYPSEYCVPLSVKPPLDKGVESQQPFPGSVHRSAPVRYEPYPSPKEKYPRARYEYVNFPNSYQQYLPTPHKYDSTKPVAPPTFVNYTPQKYVDPRIVDPHSEGYSRPAQPVRSFNTAQTGDYFATKFMLPSSHYPLQNKIYGYPMDASIRHLPTMKSPYDTGRSYYGYDYSRLKPLQVSENPYMSEIPAYGSRPQFPIHNYTLNNAHPKPTNYYYHHRNDNIAMKAYPEHLSQYKCADLRQNAAHNPLARIPAQFSPNIISPAESNTSTESVPTLGTPHEDCGYASQGSTASGKSFDIPHYKINQYDHSVNDSRAFASLHGSHMKNPIEYFQNNNENTSGKDNKNIDVRQFLQSWDEHDEDEVTKSKDAVNTGEPVASITIEAAATPAGQQQLYVLDLVNIPSEEIDKYGHIQKVCKLPENIRGYDSADLLNKFDEAFRPSPSIDYVTSNILQDLKSHPKSMVHNARPPSPFDVEAKITQSVIHKDVGCNFEIKPCSPPVKSLDAASAIQLDERKIEKIVNQHIVQPIISNPLQPILDIGLEVEGEKNILKYGEKRKSSSDDSEIINSKIMKTVESKCRFNSDNSNHGTNDKEYGTVSGECLASLPTLDNEMEYFTEINQQYSDSKMNKESVIISVTNNAALTSHDDTNKNLQWSKLSPVHCRNEKEFNSKENSFFNDSQINSFPIDDTSNVTNSRKLSKFRKTKTPVIKEQKFEKSIKPIPIIDSPQENSPVQRTDSVIIKNPDSLEHTMSVQEECIKSPQCVTQPLQAKNSKNKSVWAHSFTNTIKQTDFIDHKKSNTECGISHPSHEKFPLPGSSPINLIMHGPAEDYTDCIRPSLIHCINNESSNITDKDTSVNNCENIQNETKNSSDCSKPDLNEIPISVAINLSIHSNQLDLYPSSTDSYEQHESCKDPSFTPKYNEITSDCNTDEQLKTKKEINATNTGSGDKSNDFLDGEKNEDKSNIVLSQYTQSNNAIQFCEVETDIDNQGPISIAIEINENEDNQESRTVLDVEGTNYFPVIKPPSPLKTTNNSNEKENSPNYEKEDNVTSIETLNEFIVPTADIIVVKEETPLIDNHFEVDVDDQIEENIENIALHIMATGNIFTKGNPKDSSVNESIPTPANNNDVLQTANVKGTLSETFSINTLCNVSKPIKSCDENEVTIDTVRSGTSKLIENEEIIHSICPNSIIQNDMLCESFGSRDNKDDDQTKQNLNEIAEVTLITQSNNLYSNDCDKEKVSNKVECDTYKSLEENSDQQHDTEIGPTGFSEDGSDVISCHAEIIEANNHNSPELSLSLATTAEVKTISLHKNVQLQKAADEVVTISILKENQISKMHNDVLHGAEDTFDFNANAKTEISNDLYSSKSDCFIEPDADKDCITSTTSSSVNVNLPMVESETFVNILSEKNLNARSPNHITDHANTITYVISTENGGDVGLKSDPIKDTTSQDLVMIEGKEDLYTSISQCSINRKITCVVEADHIEDNKRGIDNDIDHKNIDIDSPCHNLSVQGDFKINPAVNMSEGDSSEKKSFCRDLTVSSNKLVQKNTLNVSEVHMIYKNVSSNVGQDVSEDIKPSENKSICGDSNVSYNRVVQENTLYEGLPSKENIQCGLNIEDEIFFDTNSHCDFEKTCIIDQTQRKRNSYRYELKKENYDTANDNNELKDEIISTVMETMENVNTNAVSNYLPLQESEEYVNTTSEEYLNVHCPNHIADENTITNVICTENGETDVPKSDSIRETILRDFVTIEDKELLYTSFSHCSINKEIACVEDVKKGYIDIEMGGKNIESDYLSNNLSVQGVFKTNPAVDDFEADEISENKSICKDSTFSSNNVVQNNNSDISEGQMMNENVTSNNLVQDNTLNVSAGHKISENRSFGGDPNISSNKVVQENTLDGGLPSKENIKFGSNLDNEILCDKNNQSDSEINCIIDQERNLLYREIKNNKKTTNYSKHKDEVNCNVMETIENINNKAKLEDNHNCGDPPNIHIYEQEIEANINKNLMKSSLDLDWKHTNISNYSTENTSTYVDLHEQKNMCRIVEKENADAFLPHSSPKVIYQEIITDKDDIQCNNLCKDIIDQPFKPLLTHEKPFEAISTGHHEHFVDNTVQSECNSSLLKVPIKNRAITSEDSYENGLQKDRGITNNLDNYCSPDIIKVKTMENTITSVIHKENAMDNDTTEINYFSGDETYSMKVNIQENMPENESTTNVDQRIKGHSQTSLGVVTTLFDVQSNVTKLSKKYILAGDFLSNDNQDMSIDTKTNYIAGDEDFECCKIKAFDSESVLMTDDDVLNKLKEIEKKIENNNNLNDASILTCHNNQEIISSSCLNPAKEDNIKSLDVNIVETIDHYHTDATILSSQVEKFHSFAENTGNESKVTTFSKVANVSETPIEKITNNNVYSDSHSEIENKSNVDISTNCNKNITIHLLSSDKSGNNYKVDANEFSTCSLSTSLCITPIINVNSNDNKSYECCNKKVINFDQQKTSSINFNDAQHLPLFEVIGKKKIMKGVILDKHFDKINKCNKNDVSAYSADNFISKQMSLINRKNRDSRWDKKNTEQTIGKKHSTEIKLESNTGSLLNTIMDKKNIGPESNSSVADVAHSDSMELSSHLSFIFENLSKKRRHSDKSLKVTESISTKFPASQICQHLPTRANHDNNLNIPTFNSNMISKTSNVSVSKIAKLFFDDKETEKQKLRELLLSDENIQRNINSEKYLAKWRNIDSDIVQEKNLSEKTDDAHIQSENRDKSFKDSSFIPESQNFTLLGLDKTVLHDTDYVCSKDTLSKTYFTSNKTSKTDIFVEGCEKKFNKYNSTNINTDGNYSDLSKNASVNSCSNNLILYDELWSEMEVSMHPNIEMSHFDYKNDEEVDVSLNLIVKSASRQTSLNDKTSELTSKKVNFKCDDNKITDHINVESTLTCEIETNSFTNEEKENHERNNDTVTAHERKDIKKQPMLIADNNFDKKEFSGPNKSPDMVSVKTSEEIDEFISTDKVIQIVAQVNHIAVVNSYMEPDSTQECHGQTDNVEKFEPGESLVNFEIDANEVNIEVNNNDLSVDQTEHELSKDLDECDSSQTNVINDTETLNEMTHDSQLDSTFLGSDICYPLDNSSEKQKCLLDDSALGTEIESIHLTVSCSDVYEKENNADDVFFQDENTQINMVLLGSEPSNNLNLSFQELHSHNDLDACENSINVEYEEIWIDDVACVETVVSEDVAEEEIDGDDSSSDSPTPALVQLTEYENNQMEKSKLGLNFDSTKIKNIYGVNMDTNEINLVETLYRTPYMNVQSKLNDPDHIPSRLRSSIMAPQDYNEVHKHLDQEVNISDYNDSFKVNYNVSDKKPFNVNELLDVPSTGNVQEISKFKYSRCNMTNSYTDSKRSKKLITKAAQKYIPPLKLSSHDLKVKLPLPEDRLETLKHLKAKQHHESTHERSPIPKLKIRTNHFRKSHGELKYTKKLKPKFEDVLKHIDDTQYSINMKLRNRKRSEKAVPKVIIKKNENGSHYTSTPVKRNFNPDLTGNKWQPWVRLEKCILIDKILSEGKMQAIFCHTTKKFVISNINQRKKYLLSCIEKKANYSLDFRKKPLKCANALNNRKRSEEYIPKSNHPKQTSRIYHPTPRQQQGENLNT